MHKLGLPLLLISFVLPSDPAFAEAAVAHGVDGQGRSISFVVGNFKSAGDARARVLAKCREAGLQNCEVTASFNKRCVTVWGNNAGRKSTYGTYYADTVEDARRGAARECRALGFSCNYPWSFCDTVSEENRTPTQTHADEREDQAALERERTETQRVAGQAERDAQENRERQASEIRERQRADRESVKGVAEKHVRENVCKTTIRDAFAGETQGETKKQEKFLTASCEKCFVDGLTRKLSREELSSLDLLLGGRSQTLTANVVVEIQRKYDALFTACSEALVKEMAEALKQGK